MASAEYALPTLYGGEVMVRSTELSCSVLLLVASPSISLATKPSERGVLRGKGYFDGRSMGDGLIKVDVIFFSELSWLRKPEFLLRKH